MRIEVVTQGCGSCSATAAGGQGDASNSQDDVPLQAIAADVEAGRYKAKPSRVFRFEDIQEAHRVMEANQANGKMVVTL